MTTALIPAVGYARRSTEMQEQSIIDQKACVERYAKENGYHILRWFVDDAISGTSVRGRDAFERLVREAESNADFQALLCYDISRFSRGGTNETGFYLHRLSKVGIKTIFTAEGIPQGDEGELLQGVKSWQARQYSVKLSRDTIRGMISMVMQRRSAPGGCPPFGYDKQQVTVSGQILRTLRWLRDGRKQELGPDGKLVRILEVGESLKKAKGDLVRYVPSLPERVATVKRIFEQYLAGFGCFAIASHLNTDGVLSSSHHMWTQMDIRRIITNPAYRGAIAWNRCSNAKIHSVDGDGKIAPRTSGKMTAHSQDRWYVIEDVHEPLVAKEIFEKAQHRLAQRRFQGGQAKPTHRALLSGLIVCTHCKHCFRHRTSRRRSGGKSHIHRLYADGGYHKSGRAKCICIEIPAEALESWVVEKVRKVIRGDHGTIRKAIDSFIKRVMDAPAKVSPKVTPEQELESLNKRIRATAAMVADPSLGDMEELRNVLIELKNKRDLLLKVSAKRECESKPKRSESELRDWAQEKVEAFDGIGTGTTCSKESRDVIQSCVIKIEIDPHTKQGTLFLPADAHEYLEHDLYTRDTLGERARVRGLWANICPNPLNFSVVLFNSNLLTTLAVLSAFSAPPRETAVTGNRPT